MLVVVLATTGLVVALIRNRIGRLLRALGDSPVALSTQGLSVNITRVLVFSIAAAMAGGTGALIAAQVGRVAGSGFTSFDSLVWLAVLVICGRRPVLSAFLAAGLLAVVPAYAPEGFLNYQTMLFGAAALLATVVPELDFGRRVETSEVRRLRSPVRARTIQSNPAAAHTAQAVPAGGVR